MGLLQSLGAKHCLLYLATILAGLQRVQWADGFHSPFGDDDTARIYSSRDYGIQFMEFNGIPRPPIQVQRTPITVWMWIKCFRTNIAASGSSEQSGRIMLQGFFLPFYTPVPTLNLYWLITAEEGMNNWEPEVRVSVSNSSTLHGWSAHPSIAAILTPGLGLPNAPRQWAGGQRVPSALSLNMTLPGVDLNTTDLPMRIQIEDWEGVHLLSTGYCPWYDPAGPGDATGGQPAPNQRADSSSGAGGSAGGNATLVVTRKPAFGLDLIKWAPWTIAHIAFHLCLGFHKYVLYAYRDQAPVLAEEPQLAALSAAGLLEIVEWPYLQYAKWNASHNITHPSDIHGVAQDTLFYTHTLLAYWQPLQRAYVFGCDLDEYVGTERPVDWPAFFSRHPQGAVVLNTSSWECTAADSSSGLPDLRSCSARADLKTDPRLTHWKSFLDTQRVAATDEAHSAVGFGAADDPDYFGYVPKSEMLLVHLFNMFRPRGGQFTVKDDGWLWVTNSTCFEQLSGGY